MIDICKLFGVECIDYCSDHISYSNSSVWIKAWLTGASAGLGLIWNFVKWECSKSTKVWLTRCWIVRYFETAWKTSSCQSSPGRADVNYVWSGVWPIPWPPIYSSWGTSWACYHPSSAMERSGSPLKLIQVYRQRTARLCLLSNQDFSKWGGSYVAV